MEKSSLIKIKGFFFGLFSGLDRQLGLILLGLAAIGFFTFLSASQNTPVQIADELRNLALSFIVMWIVSRIPPKWLETGAVWIYGFGLLSLIALVPVSLGFAADPPQKIVIGISKIVAHPALDAVEKGVQDDK